MFGYRISLAMWADTNHSTTELLIIFNTLLWPLLWDVDCLFTHAAWSHSYSTATFLWWSAKWSFTQRPSSSVSYCAVSGRLQPGSKQMADCHNYISESEAQRSESSLESVTERPLRAALDVYSCSHPLCHPWFKGLWRHLWLLKDCSRNWNL